MAKSSDDQADSFGTENTGGLFTGFLAEEEGVDRRFLLKLGTWGAASVGAVIIALMANQSSLGSRREQLASSDLMRQLQQAQLLERESQSETRRLASAIETLNGDRDRLFSRVTALELGLDSATGAIAKQNSAALPAIPAAPAVSPAPVVEAKPAPVVAPVATVTPPPAPAPDKKQAVAAESARGTVSSITPAPELAKEPPREISREVPKEVSKDAAKEPSKEVSSSKEVSGKSAAMTPAANTPPAPLMAAKSIMAPPDPAAAKLTEPAPPAAAAVAAPIPEVVASLAEGDGNTTSPAVAVTHTEFAVDIGGANSLGGLRALWRGLLKSNSALGALHPIVMVRESNTGFGMQLRLAAGPISDAAAAAKICAALVESERPCATTVFDGQRLAMKADEQPAITPRPAAKPTQHRHGSYPKRAINVETPETKPEPTTFSSFFSRR